MAETGSSFGGTVDICEAMMKVSVGGRTDGGAGFES